MVIKNNTWGRPVPHWDGYHSRKDEAKGWCQGPMVHGRFSVDEQRTWAYIFYFKNRRDAMAFKLAWGGE